jgi:predicted ATPase
MELAYFNIQNFRSINDSGKIDVRKITSLVGRNESGKSNLLLALSSINPAGGRTALQPIKDFPRGRRLEECKTDTHVVWTWWKLTPDETAALAAVLPGADEIKEIAIGRGYGADLWISRFTKAPTPDSKKVAASIRQLGPVLSPKWEVLEDPHKTNCIAAWKALEEANADPRNAKAWAASIANAATALRKHLGAAAIMLEDAQDEMIAAMEQQATMITGFDAAYGKAQEAITSWLPKFVYVSDFPELYGHQNLDRYTQSRGKDPSLIERDDNFEKLARVADFDPEYLNSHRDDHETRSQLLNRAGSLVTGEIRRLWKDRELMIRFNLDGPHLDVLVSDPNATYPIEVNLDERSRGFRWFFAFYMTFSADTQGGNADGAVLLLDEPGLYLHAKSQENLLKHLREDYKNQIIYTTHSPFMVPPDDISIVRTVNIDPSGGTTVSDTPTGDSRTLFPLQAALGYTISQTLFVGHSNLVVEGVTDFWILSAVNSYLVAAGVAALPEELTLTPAGGAGKVPYMTALLVSQETQVLVLLDDDRAGRETRDDLVKNKLVRDGAVLFVSEGFPDPRPGEADIEDLIDPTVYDGLVKHTYAKEMEGKRLVINPKIPRIVKRYEAAFAALGLEFHKTRPAREFMARMGTDPPSVLPPESTAKFEAIFRAARGRYEKIKVSGNKPFT